MPELGKKHECPNCGIKFYDLGKATPLCPKCGTNVKEFEADELALISAAARKRRKVDLPEESEGVEEGGDIELDDEILEGGDDEEEAEDLDDDEA